MRARRDIPMLGILATPIVAGLLMAALAAAAPNSPIRFVNRASEAGIRIQTTNGELRLRAALAADATLDTEAINGDLSFLLQSPVNAELDIETFKGDIDNCFGPKSVRTREFAPGNALRFKEGNGSARVRVKTLNGGVEICR